MMMPPLGIVPSALIVWLQAPPCWLQLRLAISARAAWKAYGALTSAWRGLIVPP